MFENAIRVLIKSLSPLEEIDKLVNDETKAAIKLLQKESDNTEEKILKILDYEGEKWLIAKKLKNLKNE